jgi:predicted nucleic acid-binding protein
MIWVDAIAHQTYMELLLTIGQRDLSLTDCASFITMRSQQLDTAFAFDQHFHKQGFNRLNETP